MVSLIVKDANLIELAPLDVNPDAPIPEDRRETQIFAPSVYQRSSLRPDEPVLAVTEI